MLEFCTLHRTYDLCVDKGTLTVIRCGYKGCENIHAHYWANDNDPGDSGYVRDCRHGGYV